MLFINVFLIFNALGYAPIVVSDIQFVIDEDCLFVGYELTLEDDYATYQWEDAINPNAELGIASSIMINYSSTYCVTTTDDLGVSCTACVDIELLEEDPFGIIGISGSVCNVNNGVGATFIDLNELISGGSANGTWSDIGFSGVDLSDPTNVDFEGFPIGAQYQFIYTEVGACFDQSAEIFITVVDCECPVPTLAAIGPFCNSGAFDLSAAVAPGLNGNWSSNELSIQDNIIYLDGLEAGVYICTFSISDDIGGCPTDFETTIEIIGCFQVDEVLSVDVSIDQLMFSWTDELEALDLEIVILQGPIGVRDGNTYIMSNMSPGEEGGIEIFINTEGYQYDNDLLIYGQTLTTSIDDNYLNEMSINLYPNPVTEVLQLDIFQSDSSIKSVEILTSDGVLLKNDFKVLDDAINVSDLNTGFYMLSIELNGNIVQLPFIKI